MNIIKNRWLILIFVILLVGAFMTYIALNSKKETKEINISDINDYIFINRLTYFDNLNKSFKTSELTNEEISEYIYFVYGDYFEHNESKSFSAEEIEVLIKKVFGDGIKYNHQDIHYCDQCKKYHILYDKEKKLYYKNSDIEKYENKNIMAAPTSNLEKKDNEYTLIIKNIFIHYDENDKLDGFYGNYNDAINGQNIIYDISKHNFSKDTKKRKEEIEKLVNDNYKELENKLTTYKYTFKLDSDNNLYFYSYEIIK